MSYYLRQVGAGAREVTEDLFLLASSAPSLGVVGAGLRCGTLEDDGEGGGI